MNVAGEKRAENENEKKNNSENKRKKAAIPLFFKYKTVDVKV